MVLHRSQKATLIRAVAISIEHDALNAHFLKQLDNGKWQDTLEQIPIYLVSLKLFLLCLVGIFRCGYRKNLIK
jgi:hypothetical protein